MYSQKLFSIHGSLKNKAGVTVSRFNISFLEGGAWRHRRKPSCFAHGHFDFLAKIDKIQFSCYHAFNF